MIRIFILNSLTWSAVDIFRHGGFQAEAEESSHCESLKFLSSGKHSKI